MKINAKKYFFHPFHTENSTMYLVRTYKRMIVSMLLEVHACQACAQKCVLIKHALIVKC